jgi:hypothetical protein
MNSANSTDPFAVLKLSPDAGEAEIRSRYLELVKQFPPETDPDKFREVRAAYEAIKDPLVIARRLLIPPNEISEWDQVIEAQKRNPPRLTAAFLLSLGNRAADASGPAVVAENHRDPNSSVAPQQLPGGEMSPRDSAPPSHEVDAR